MINRDSLKKLRLDRRLIRRRGWIGKAELEREMQDLPDAARKSTTLGAASDDRGDPDGSTSRDGAPSGA